MRFSHFLPLSLLPSTIVAVVVPPISIDKEFQAVGQPHKLYFGTATDHDILQGNPNECAVIRTDFGTITPLYSMKWATVHPTAGQWNFAGPDALMNWARTNHQRHIRGHCLLWWDQLPQYVADITDAKQMQSAIEDHIKTLVSRYRGKIYAWDVVNEPFDSEGNWRSWPVFNVLGESYIKIAFEAAKKADPGAKLYINSYNLDNTAWPMLTTMTSKVKAWRSQGIPIDGIGSQSHLQAGMANAVPAALEAVCAAAPECAVTELDIVGANPQEYVEVVFACKNIKNCVGVTVWGVSDAGSWESGSPLLFDNNYVPKDAYYALRDSL